jgi:hypothetical protein
LFTVSWHRIGDRRAIPIDGIPSSRHQPNIDCSHLTILYFNTVFFNMIYFFSARFSISVVSRFYAQTKKYNNFHMLYG